MCRNDEVQDQPAADGQYYFEIQAGGNYETLATSETYKRPDKRDVRAAIDQIRREVVDDSELAAGLQAASLLPLPA